MMQPAIRVSESLCGARLAMVISSISPLFVLLAIRGTSLMPDKYFATVCGLLFIGSNGFLFLRIRTAQKQQEERVLSVGSAQDSRGHVLVYLFTILLPFYRQSVDSWRDLSAMAVALAFIIFLFWHLNYHYMNISFAIKGYRVLEMHTPDTANRYSGRQSWVLITRRTSDKVVAAQTVRAYRVSDSVYMEKSK